MKSERRSFLHLLLMAHCRCPLHGLCSVLWDGKAELYYLYWKKCSELAVIGQFETCQYRDRMIHEVVSENLLLLCNIDWERGELLRKKYYLPTPNAGDSDHVFIVGEVLEDLHFQALHRGLERGGGEFACLRKRLKSDEYLDGLRVMVPGTLAELAHPYLLAGSKIAVDGALQTRDRETSKKMVEVVTHNLTFLENINWAAGDAARQMAGNPGSDLRNQAELAGLFMLTSNLYGD